MARISELIRKIPVIATRGDVDPEIERIEFDSRKAGPGTLFVAVRGTKSDGHDFIGSAVAAGAVAVICGKIPGNASDSVRWIATADPAEALGIVASEFYGNPSSLLKLTGVTGTNGKTTTATLLYRMFSALGYKCGLFSTVCNYIAGRELPATHTTPDPVVLNRTLAEMVEEGCDYAFMEVSSHAVDQKRIAGLVYAGGIFTNLTHDHLDYHLTFDNYLNAKKRFFDSLGPGAFALVNADDRNGKVMIQNCNARKYYFSVKSMADFRCSVIEEDFGGMHLRIQGRDVWTGFTGDFNASNLLAVYASSELLGAKSDEILTALSSMGPVPGRLEKVASKGSIYGIVDYAHTPDALLNVISTINKIRVEGCQLITVVGAGGDRDRTKRPRMALISAEGSSKVILTSDNPRTEDPEKILDDMEAGITPELKKKVLRITGRREAIKTAVMLAAEGDVILVAGKGHETYQEIKGIRHHFDDREELKAALDSRYNL
ncbi:MAG: UDP-N-acetylmuramoyl-L-alanyl-D-glutamate--2,6-diaminopimelate ligase [Bacteroidales bacterium]|jgi:UDP-N-acetylmuramoyl-L-alanyl-D-glutamate--2,6-diaminopimelate ligase|nr:UDP-N-acetylmuramoyl-L-alanyl-D-glutamate--2,6-diaminopimelate ligase [Bacteroidales bacterium]